MAALEFSTSLVTDRGALVLIASVLFLILQVVTIVVLIRRWKLGWNLGEWLGALTLPIGMRAGGYPLPISVALVALGTIARRRSDGSRSSESVGGDDGQGTPIRRAGRKVSESKHT